ncbi:DAZ-associated protein 2 [Anopheles bellator]|uniref:DAZ-associated protein 2 n=1 Tax=Anopheles cruzii TaxID=68878 RepID=UPI0022EC9136|nr:DAZ-associated protein 2 [Anopheles cruzii]XP_058053939.1 DAZ-associated protein 2 [Anopheles bellator]
MNNKGANGYPYDAAQQAVYQQYMNSQMPVHAQLPPSYNSVVTSMTPTYPPYPPGMMPQPFYSNSWSMNPSPQPQFAPPPPPYAPTQATVAAIPAQTVHPSMYQYQLAAAPPQAQPPQVYQTQMYPVQGAMYDAGARFGKSGGAPTIPPPPPGIAPNAAQMATMQGQPVVMTKKKNNFVHGGNGSGYTFW